VRERYPDAVDDLLGGPDHYLVDATNPPGDPKTLVDRTVNYLWQFRDVCDASRNLPPERTFANILDTAVPGAGAGDRWRKLYQAAESA
jgi:hypothetical protein